MENTELYHHGIKNQRWGIRRFQNKDGSLTPAGKKRYNSEASDAAAKIKAINDRTKAQIRAMKEQNYYKAKIAKAEAAAAAKIAKAEARYKKKENTQKKISEMTDEEINSRINRIQLENKLRSLEPQKVSKGKLFVDSVVNNVIAPAAMEAGKNLLKSFIDKKGKELLNLNDDTKKNSYDELKKSVDELDLRKRLKELNKYFEDEKKNTKKDTNKDTNKDTKKDTKKDTNKDTKKDENKDKKKEDSK